MVMKKYCVILAVVFLPLNSASGELKNGYEKRILYLRQTLREFTERINGNNGNSLTSEKRKLKDCIEELITYQSYYELTEELVNRFRAISPTLYNKIDSVKDAKGRSIDVYVKFIPREEGLIMAAGTTYMAQSNDDDNACYSEYGKYTVSVKIWTISKALFVLSHELGHVGYQVPNLATYTAYYKEVYHLSLIESNYVGHEYNDPSGRNATNFEVKFRKDYVDYLRLRSGDQRLESPLALIHEIRKKVQFRINQQVISGYVIKDQFN